MSQARHPKSDAIDAMLWRFAAPKEIKTTLKVNGQRVNNRAYELGLKFHRITSEECALLAERRKAKGLIR